MCPGEGETLDALAGDFRIFQRRYGHRYSTDDLLTAWYGCALAEGLWGPPNDGVRGSGRRVVDLGCGIGSVLLLCAWRLPGARCDGLEAQEESHRLAERSIRWNGVEGRVTARHGDLRDTARRADLRGADLVTGSPPYLDAEAATRSPDSQREHCRIERRGGVEAYWEAMADILGERGIAVLVHEWAQRGRVHQGAREAGLDPFRTQPVVFREGREPFIALYAARRASGPWAATTIDDPLIIRRADGQRGERFREIRAGMGFPP